MKHGIYNGKIGRLPAAIRNEVCQRIFDGQPGSVILPWLNRNEAVKEVMKARFDGAPINDANLTEWRQGGYQDWLNETADVARLRAKSEIAIALAKAANGQLSEGAAAIAGGKLLELMERADINAAPTGEDGEKEGYSINDLVDAVTSIRDGDIELRKLELKKADGVRADRKLDLEEIRIMRETSEIVRKALKDEKLRSEFNSTDDNTAQLELIGKRMFGERWKGIEPAA